MHIFISYAKKDSRELARRLYEVLNSLPNMSAWMDDSLQPASSWARQIEQEIDKCDYMVVLLSPDLNRPRTDSQAQSFVLREISYAQAQHKRILAVMAMKTKIPIQLADEQYLDFTLDLENGIKDLVDFLLQQSDISPAPLPKYSDAQVIKDSKQKLPNRSWWQKLNWGGKIGTGLTVFMAILLLIALASSPDPSIYFTSGGFVAYLIMLLVFAVIFIGMGQVVGGLIGSLFRVLFSKNG